MKYLHWTNKEDETLVAIAMQYDRINDAVLQASKELKRSDKAVYLRIYTLRKKGKYDVIAKRIGNKPYVALTPQPTPTPSATDRTIEMDVKQMIFTNGKLIIHF
jgi:hypothetical protein